MKHIVLTLAAVALLAGCQNRYEDSPVLDGFDEPHPGDGIEAAPAPENPAPAHESAAL